jgi:hypothetical protein
MSTDVAVVRFDIADCRRSRLRQLLDLRSDYELCLRAYSLINFLITSIAFPYEMCQSYIVIL